MQLLLLAIKSCERRRFKHIRTRGIRHKNSFSVKCNGPRINWALCSIRPCGLFGSAYKAFGLAASKGIQLSPSVGIKGARTHTHHTHMYAHTHTPNTLTHTRALNSRHSRLSSRGIALVSVNHICTHTHTHARPQTHAKHTRACARAHPNALTRATLQQMMHRFLSHMTQQRTRTRFQSFLSQRLATR